MFDVITIAKCEELFEFVESNIAIWKEEVFFQVIKNNLLRTCNGTDLLGYFQALPTDFETFLWEKLSHLQPLELFSY